MMKSVFSIDCEYVSRGRASAYLIVEGERAVFVDNNTSRAVPLLMRALHEHGIRPENVEYAIVTHVHLDHAGGTSALIKECPNAVVLAHPKAVKHLVSPERLVAASKRVYGEDLFDKIYGSIEPVDAARVRSVNDGEEIRFGDRAFSFFYTLGHATHHVCIHDSATNGVFTGDNFGICYPELTHGPTPYIFCVATPTEYDSDHYRVGIQQILATGAERVYLGHYGEFLLTESLTNQLIRSVDRVDEVIVEALESGLGDSALRSFVYDRVKHVMENEVVRCGLALSPETRFWLEPDIMLNGSGLTYAIEKRLRRRVSPSSM